MLVAGQPLGKLLVLLALVATFVFALLGVFDPKLAIVLGMVEVGVLIL